MPVSYPRTLPGPVSYAFTPRERRALSQSDGTQQLRTRARDVITDAKSVRWMLTCAELVLWNTFYETTLLHGQRWFVMPLPGYLGKQNRVVRFVTPVTRVHRQAGIFELQADLEIRGVSALPGIPGVVEPAPAVGWHSPVGNVAGTAAHANSGTSPLFTFSFPTVTYASVVGYTAGVVTWTPIWTPTGADPSPLFSYPAPEIIRIDWPQIFDATFYHFPTGLLTLAASVDGSPVTPPGQRIQMAVSTSFGYSGAAWGPEP